MIAYGLLLVVLVAAAVWATLSLQEKPAALRLLAAALAWVTLRLARHYFPDRPGPALLSWLLLALFSPLLLYAPQIWVEVAREPHGVFDFVRYERDVRLG